MVKKKRITKKMLFAKTIEILQPRLNLADWKIVVRYSKTMKTAVADCQSLPEYKQATIRLSMKRLPEFSHYEVISTAVHEMMHCIVWPLTEWAEDLCKKDAQKLQVTRRLDESVITSLEKIITDMAGPLVKNSLVDDGYEPIDLSYDTIRFVNERPAVAKPKKKAKKINKKPK